MAKRPGGNERFGGSLNYKKPKLDVSIQKKNELNYGASTSKNNDENIFKKPNTLPVFSTVWNDDLDDDDDLLMISQMVENKIQSHDLCTTNTNSDMFNNISITFENFGHQVKSSTQMPVQTSETIIRKESITKSTVNQDSSSLFDESFDFEWEDNNFEKANETNTNKHKSTTMKYGIETVQQKTNNSRPKLMSLKNENLQLLQRDSVSSNISTPTDRQHDAIEIEKLIQSLDSLQCENKKQLIQINTLSDQINDLNEKIQTKEGEASILRHELRTSKQTLDTLRIQKISENDNFRKEYQNKITELERIKNVIQAELNQKKIENVQLKQKNAVGGNTTEIIRKYQNLSEINKLNFRLEEKLTEKKKIPSELFLKSNVPNYNFIENYFQKQFERLCSMLAEWNLVQCNKNCILETGKMFTDGIEKLIKYLELNTSKFNKLGIGKTIEVDEKIDCSLCLKKMIVKQTAFCPNKISKFERTIPFRRFIAVFCFMLENIPELKNVTDSVKEIFISSETNFETVLKLMMSSSTVDYYSGILESFVLILTTLAKTNNFIESYIKYFNIISLHLPNLRIMAEISDCLQEISKQKCYLDKMCKKSPKFQIVYSGNKKIVKIPNTGCVLQTFCTILEYRIKKQEFVLYKNKFEIFRIFENYIKLLGNCFKFYPVFMIDPSFKNINLSDSSVRNSYEVNHSICNCYALTCCSFISIFNQFLKFWEEDKKSFDLNIVQELCQTASTLLGDIFDSYYQPVIVFIGNIGIKKNLFIILNCLERNQEILNLDYENELKNILKSSIFTDTELNTENLEEINKTSGTKILDKIFTKDSFL